MIFKREKKEKFIGSARIAVDEETENFLRAFVPERTKIREDGIIITKWPDGHIEFETVYQRCIRLVKEMRGE